MSAPSTRFALDRYFEQLSQAQRDYRIAARRKGQFEYVAGTLIGTVLTTALIGGIAVGIHVGGHSVKAAAVATALGCAIAGMLGAAASVSWRAAVAGNLVPEASAGILVLRRLGALRSPIGAVFGLAVYFAVKSGFVDIGSQSDNFYFFAFIAFLGGFSERLVPDLLHAAESRFAGGGNAAPPATTPWWKKRDDATP